MRLSRPKFNEPVPLFYDPGDPYSIEITNSVVGNDFTSIYEPIGSFLLAPHTMSQFFEYKSKLTVLH
jgi:hypothetical protein